MSLPRRLTAVLAASLFLALGVLAADARAGSVSYTGTFSLSPFLGSSTYTFPSAVLPKFDVPGQCLSSVCVKLDGNVQGGVSFENFDNFPKVVTTTFTAKIELLRPTLTPLVAVQPVTFTADTVGPFDGVVDYSGTSGLNHPGLFASAADSACTTATADLSLFSGPGTISLPCTATNLSSQIGANSWSFAIRATATATVTYTYTDCGVPAEPTTWGRIKGLYR